MAEENLTQAEDFLAGSVAGFAGTVVGYPFDTVKVRLQSNHATSISDCFKQISKDGFLSIYRGMSIQLFTVPLLNAIVFGSYEQGKRVMQRRRGDGALTESDLVAAGCWSGFVNSFVCGPIELVRSRMQVEHGSAIQYRNSWHALTSIVRNEGLLAPWTGTLITIMREVPCYAAQFLTFEHTKVCRRKIRAIQSHIFE